MKEKLLLFSNVGLFVLATLFFGTLQTSLWFQIFGYFPGPALWVSGLIYISLNRSALETIIFSYLVAVVLSVLTAVPEGILMISCLALSLTVRNFKERFHWSGSSYLMLTCGLAPLIFHAYHWIGSLLFEEAPLTNPQVIDWLVEALLTALFAPVLFPLFRWIDTITNREQAAEASAQFAQSASGRRAPSRPTSRSSTRQ